MVEELLKKIPAEKCWAITAKALTRIFIMRGRKHIIPLLGKGEGIIAPVMGHEKYEEITTKTWGEGSKWYYPWVKKRFNIPVEDAEEAAKFLIVATTLSHGPEFTAEIVEATPERAVLRMTKCGWWERQKELEMDPELLACPAADQARVGEGLKAINPKIAYKLIKAMPWGDPYCEGLYEFKEE